MWPLPESLSTDAHRIDRLLFHSLGVSLAIFAITVMLLGFLVLRASRRERALAHPPGTERALSLAAAAVSLGMFFGVDLPVISRAERDLRTGFWAFPRGREVVRVEVLAHRWSWNFRHPGIDNTFGTADDVFSLHDLRVPLGRPVLLSLTASDVVHGFFAPSIRLEQDAIPGRITRLWFRPSALGSQEILCAQYCGWAHPTMRGRLTVMSPEDFTRWHTESSREASRTHSEGARTTQAGLWPLEL